jgi:single-strand DNA-binding protein
MLSENSHTIIGNLGADPEIRQTNAGKKVANFNVATTRKTKDGNITDWHKVVVFGDALVDNVVSKYCVKGGQVLVSGPNQTRKYTDKNGVDRYISEIIVSGPGSTLKLGSSPRSNGASSSSNNDFPASENFGEDVPFDDPLS